MLEERNIDYLCSNEPYVEMCPIVKQGVWYDAAKTLPPHQQNVIVCWQSLGDGTKGTDFGFCGWDEDTSSSRWFAWNDEAGSVEPWPKASKILGWFWVPSAPWMVQKRG